MVLAMVMGLPPVDGAWASTEDVHSAGPGGSAAYDPEPEKNAPAPDRHDAMTDRKQPAVEPPPDELDTFSPSETIEADQGVDFPYDI